MDKEEIKSVWSECVGTITKNDLTELKSFAAPPQLAITVSTALNIILMNKKIEEKNSWKEFQKQANNPSALLKVLLQYNAQEMKAKNLEMVKAFLKEKNLDKQEDNKKVAKISRAMKQIHQWILNLIEEVEKHAELDKEIAKNEKFE